MRLRITFALLLAAAACGRPGTAPGTSLLKTTFTEAQGGPPAELSGTHPTQHVSHVTVAGGAADIEVRLGVVQGPKGRYLGDVELITAQSGGAVLSASLPSGANVVNRGTADNVLAALPLMVEWRKESVGSGSLRQTMIELVADGSAVAR